jgi:histidinol-phosphate aminotransferase
MKRRSFLRASFAAAAAPGALTLAGEPAPWLRPERRAAQGGPIRLSSNENPLGIPESAAIAIRNGLGDANRYPSLGSALENAIAAKHGVPAGNVILGAGSTDVLRMAAQALGSPTARLIVPEPTFEHVEAYARPYFPEVERVPLTADHAMDLDAMRRAGSRTRGEVLVYLCNPNNPTGTITSCDEIEAWVRERTEKFFFLIDEAYFDFVDDASYRSFIPIVRQPNILVTRTFSKVYGLAGLRLGYGIAIPEAVQRLSRFRLNNNANHLALTAALACIDDDEYIRRSIETNREAREIALAALAELELDALPSHTNFIMHRINGDLNQYRSRMLQAGFRVGRAFPPMLDYNRVSIGLPSEMERWAQALREFRSDGWV